MTPAEGLAYLASLPPSSIKMGLDRVQLALDTLGNPQRQYPAAHVAGTNGKGSTCAFIASCLAQKYKVGLYTSPHLIRVNERIKINGVDISDEELGRCAAQVRERLPDLDLTYFEFGTVVAFWHFAHERVQIAVMETGLGGRLDATTACVPKVTAITPISFDHQEYLGSTLTAIATEKAGIAKPGVPLVLSKQPPEAAAVFSALTSPSQTFTEGVDFSGAADFRYRGMDLRLDGVTLPLKGPHQTQNAAVALACLELLGRDGFALRDEQIAEASKARSGQADSKSSKASFSTVPTTQQASMRCSLPSIRSTRAGPFTWSSESSPTKTPTRWFARSSRGSTA